MKAAHDSGVPSYHPQVREMLRREREKGAKSITAFEPAEWRESAAKELSLSRKKREPVGRLEDRAIGGAGGPLGVRLYWPKAAKAGDGGPLIVYIHGGGFVAGSVEDMDGACRRLTNATRFVVASVDYRLAPENKFPAALEDCYAAVRWAHANAHGIGADPDRLVVAGSSAGGNLAAVVCILARDRGGPRVAHQVLVYPLTDAGRSLRKFSKRGFGPTEFESRWYYGHYLERPSQLSNPMVSPLRADLHGLPPATMVLAQYDTLTEQGREYAAKLRRAGVRAREREFPGMIHGFFGLVDVLDTAKEAIRWVATDLSYLRRRGASPRERTR